MELKNFNHESLEPRNPYTIWSALLDLIIAISLGALLCATYYAVQIYFL